MQRFAGAKSPDNPCNRVDHFCCYADPICLWLWRSSSRGSTPRIPYSDRSSGAARCAGLNYDCCGGGCTRLETYSSSQHRVAGRFHFGRNSPRTPSIDQHTPTCCKSASRRNHYRLLCIFVIFADEPRTAGIETRQPPLASDLWILCGNFGRRLRDERSSTGHLRDSAPLVGATISSNSARLFSACQHYWHERLLARGIVDSAGYALLPDFVARHFIGHFCRASFESPPA